MVTVITVLITKIVITAVITMVTVVTVVITPVMPAVMFHHHRHSTSSPTITPPTLLITVPECKYPLLLCPSTTSTLTLALGASAGLQVY